MSNDNPTIDQVAADGAESGKMEQNLKSRTTWLRLLFMCIYGLICSLAGMVGTVIVVLGFFWVLFTGAVNREFSAIGRQLAEYGKEIVLYMTFNTEQRPFPFDGDWPSG